MALSLSYRLALPKGVYFLLSGNLGSAWANQDFLWEEFPANFLKDAYKGLGATLTVNIPRVGPALFTAATPLFLENAEQRRKFSETYYFSLGYDF